jgi:PAS domain S-box-containing protein
VTSADFRALAHLLPEACLLVSADGEVLGVNPAAERLTGRPRSELEGARLFDLVVDAPEDTRRFLASASRTRGPVTGGLTFAGESTIVCACLGGLVDPPAGDRPCTILLRVKERESTTNRFRLLDEQIDRLSQEVRRRRKAEEEQKRLLEQENATRVELERRTVELEATTARLARSQALLEESQRSARVGSWEWDVGTGHLTWSDELYRIYGLDPLAGPITLDRYQALLHPEDREAVQEAVGGAIEEAAPFEFDHRIVRPDGTVRVVHGRGRAIVDGRGSVVRMIGSGQDITERKREEERSHFLAEAGRVLTSSLDYRETLRRVVELAVPRIADWAALDVQQDGAIRRLAVAHPDPAKRELAEDMARRWPANPEDPAGVAAVQRTGEPLLLPTIPDSFLAEAARSEEHLEMLRDLGLRSAMVVAMAARGQILGSITFVSSESGRRFDEEDLELARELADRAALAVDNARLYEAAQAASQARDDLMAIVSHDLRSPLTAVLAGASLLLDVPLPEEKRQDQYRAIRRSAQRMERLTRDLLDITRIEAGYLRVEPGTEDVRALIEEALEGANHAAGRTGVFLTSRVPDDLPLARADRARVLQVLDNLLTNAIRHTPQGGRVTVGADASPESVRVCVADTGPGIPPELRDHVFNRYYQAENSAHGGAGLGLAIAKGIIEAHGGAIWLDREVARGTTVYFTLPRARGQEDEGSAVA